MKLSNYTLCLSRHIKILVTSLRYIWHFISYCKFYISTPEVMVLSCLNKCFLTQQTMWTTSLQELSLSLVVDVRNRPRSLWIKSLVGEENHNSVFSSEKAPMSVFWFLIISMTLSRFNFLLCVLFFRQTGEFTTVTKLSIVFIHTVSAAKMIWLLNET